MQCNVLEFHIYVVRNFMISFFGDCLVLHYFWSAMFSQNTSLVCEAMLTIATLFSFCSSHIFLGLQLPSFQVSFFDFFFNLPRSTRWLLFSASILTLIASVQITVIFPQRVFRFVSETGNGSFISVCCIEPALEKCPH